MKSLSTFVLIHGGWHGGWCWDRVVPLLEAQGHRAVAPDLPGHGADRTPLTAKPYELYVPKVCAVLNELDERAILVGHSSGGTIITEAYRRSGKLIKGLVYLSAFLLPVGKTPREVMRIDDESLLTKCLQVDIARGVSTVGRECAKPLFYEDCSDEDAAWAINQLRPEPLIPFGPAVAVSGDEPLHRVPRFYIECLKDRALSPSVQRWMYTQSPCDAVYSLGTSHSPFISAPHALTRHLLQIDRTVS